MFKSCEGIGHFQLLTPFADWTGFAGALQVSLQIEAGLYSSKSSICSCQDSLDSLSCGHLIDSVLKCFALKAHLKGSYFELISGASLCSVLWCLQAGSRVCHFEVLLGEPWRDLGVGGEHFSRLQIHWREGLLHWMQHLKWVISIIL